MKVLYMLTLGALCFIPTIAGTVASADGAVAGTAYESVNRNITPLALMRAQAASSDAMLSRPL